MKTLKNTILTLTLIALSCAHLGAMKRPRSEEFNEPTEQAAKRLKTELPEQNNNIEPNKQTATVNFNDKKVSLRCKNGKIIKNVPYKILTQSETLKNLFDDCGGIAAFAQHQELPVHDIDHEVMLWVLHYMKRTTELEQDGCTRKNIIDELVKTIQINDLMKDHPQTFFKILDAVNYLDCNLIQCSLSRLCAQNIDIFKKSCDVYHKLGGFILPDHLNNIDIAYKISIDPHNPLVLTLKDLAQYGLINPELITQNITSILTAIFEMRMDSNDLQQYLTTISSFPSLMQLAVNAHHKIMEWIRNISQDQIEQLFNQLVTESRLKMALRLVYAQKHNANLDGLDCVALIKHIGNFVNNNSFHGLPVQDFQDYLQDIFPFIEPLLGQQVTILNFSGTGLTKLPDSIDSLVNVTELRLTNNRLTSLPETIGNLVSLKGLFLCFNQLTNIPASIGRLVNLKRLYLRSNQLTNLPVSIGNLGNLIELLLNNNQLTSLPETIGNLGNLIELLLNDNQLTSLPETIGNLGNLIGLLLSGNQLTSLPETIGNLGNLTRLNLINNRLTCLPETISNLGSLIVFRFYNNQIP